jgi:hypothetical protein
VTNVDVRKQIEQIKVRQRIQRRVEAHADTLHMRFAALLDASPADRLLFQDAPTADQQFADRLRILPGRWDEAANIADRVQRDGPG